MKNQRNINLAKIHLAKKQLGLDDDTYRSIIHQAAGKDSAAKCTDRQLVKIVELLKSKGWKNGNNKPKQKLSPSIKKIYGLWGELQRAGKIKSQEATALDRFVAKYTDKTSVKALTDAEAWKIIEILKKIVERD